MPPAAVGGDISVPVASGTRQTSPDMIVSNGNEAKKSEKKTIGNPDDAFSGNSIISNPDDASSGNNIISNPDDASSGNNIISNPDDASSGNSIVIAANGNKQTVPEMMLSNENQTKKSGKGMMPKKTNSISDPGDPSLGNNVTVMEIETRQDVSDMLSNEEDIKEPKKRKTSKKKTSSVLMVANESKQTAPALMLSSENQTKTSRTEVNAISNPGDASSGNNFNFLVVADETKQNVPEMVSSNVNDTKKSKKRKASKTRMASVPNDGHVSPGKKIQQVAIEPERSVLKTTLTHENKGEKSKKQENSTSNVGSISNEANAISNPGDASSGNNFNFLVVADETKQNVPEMVSSNVDKTRKRKRSKTRMTSVPNDGDASPGKKIQQVASEPERTDLKTPLTHENTGEKSKNQKNSTSNVGSISNLDEIPSSKKSSFEGHSSLSPDVNPYDQRDEKRDSNAESTYFDREADVKLSSPPARARRKLLILDLNGLLAEIVTSSKELNPDKTCGRHAVFRRPFCGDFLHFCLENFDVGVWTSKKGEYVGGLIKCLFGKKQRRLCFRLSQQHCTKTMYKTLEDSEKPIFLKEIRRLYDGELCSPWIKDYYNPSNTLLIDDSPCKALRNPPYTAIFPETYSRKNADKDDSLGPKGELRLYLKRLAAADDVQEFVKNNPIGQQPITSSSPTWVFYSKVKDSPTVTDKKTRKEIMRTQGFYVFDPIE